MRCEIGRARSCCIWPRHWRKAAESALSPRLRAAPQAMSHLKRDIARKKLKGMLSRAPDDAFCAMIWAVDALQSGRSSAASRLLSFPPNAATSDITSEYIVHRWELESLVLFLLKSRKIRSRGGVNRIVDCTNFSTIANIINQLRALENSEYTIHRDRIPILMEMHRIAHRQFPWQTGFDNKSYFYRNIFIYGMGRCAEYFEQKNGVSISDFIFIGFSIYSHFFAETLDG